MASSNPVGMNPVIPISAHDVPGPQGALEIHNDDIRRVRRYSRIAAALSSLTLFLLVLGVAWLLGRWIDLPFGGSAGPAIAATLIAAARFGIAEARLRTYDIRLTGTAVTFTYGRRHIYLPIAHLQLIDTETSPLLRPLGLGRCILHTAGGMAVISPVPIRFVSALEHAMLEPGTPHLHAR